MKKNVIAKLSIGLLAAIVTIGASLAVTRATAAEPETPKAQAAVPELMLTPPRDPDAALRQIELSVALKQYEKVLTALEDTELQIDLGPEESGLYDEQIAEWRTKQGRKQMVLQDFSQRLRKKIEHLTAEAIAKLLCH